VTCRWSRLLGAGALRALLCLGVASTGCPIAAQETNGEQPAKSSSNVAAADAEPPGAGVPEVELPEIVIPLHYRRNVDTSDAASAGSTTAELVEDRPLLRPGEVLELVPGLIVTQHSGAGKANQYFLRGFNLDHGTDFATTVEGVPVNLPTNAHGQGYMDLNFLIPELVTYADYFKGPYYAEKGDFSSAGAEDIFYASELPSDLLLGTIGSFDYERALATGSPRLGEGRLLAALEVMHEDGPWQVPENYLKLNGVLRYTHPLWGGTLSLLGMGYSASWNATNQVAERAITSGEISYFGTLSPTDGGSSHRYTVSATWDGEVGGGRLRATAYGAYYGLNLFSDFTYFLVDPVNGDQMEQLERRRYEGTSGTWSFLSHPAGVNVFWKAGWEGRADEVDPIGLLHTEDRRRIGTWSLDHVNEENGALWAESLIEPARWLRLVLGLRGVLYHFDVASNDPRNSGVRDASLLLPKASAVFGPWAKTQFFANFGEGYHSNDARGVTGTIDAKTGEPISPVTPLPKSLGAELGARTEIVPRLQSSVAFWLLDLDSELVWDADNGTTSPSAPTRRLGVEWANTYQPLRWLAYDLNVAFSRAFFRSDDPTTGELAGQPVPEAIRWTVATGLSVHDLGPWSASLFMRYFGPRVLCTVGTCSPTLDPANGSAIWSRSSTLFNGQIAYQVNQNLRITLEGLNLLNARVDDIEYYYQSRLRNESPAWDYEVHPSEPLELRATVTVFL